MEAKSRAINGWILLILFLPIQLYAVQGDIELTIQSDNSRFWVSQKIVARLSVKTDAFAISNLRVETPSNDELIIIKPDSAAYKQTDTIDGVSWQSSVYEYLIYPMHAGTITLKPFNVEFSASMGYGQAAETFKLQTQAITLQVASPEGVNDRDFVLTTQSLQLDVTYTPEIETLKVGEAFERTVTITATDVPDFLLQPVPEYQSSTQDEKSPFKFYRTEPALSETKNNNSVIATRIEHDTFVAKNESVSTIPEIKIYWWNPETQQLHTESIPEKTVTIIANPLVNNKTSSPDSSVISQTEKNKKLTIWFLSLILIVLAGIYWWLTRKNHIDNSVSGHYKRLQSACSKGTRQQVYQSFYAWAKLAMPEVTPLNFQQIVRHYPELKSSLNSLETALTDKNAPFDAQTFMTQISQIHQSLLAQKTADDYDLTASLNPSHNVTLRPEKIRD